MHPQAGIVVQLNRAQRLVQFVREARREFSGDVKPRHVHQLSLQQPGPALGLPAFSDID